MLRSAYLLPLVAVLTACQMPFHRTVQLPAPETAAEPATPNDIAALEREVIDVVNRTRASGDAQRLQRNDAMMRAARAHAQELARRGVLDHASRTPGRETFARRLAAEGAPAWTLAGENLIQLPHVALDVPEEAVTGWLGSPSHRSQMLEPSYTDTGVGIAQDAAGNWYVVQLFIRQR
jgi:uncharacterized protein YkwD